MKFKQFFDTCVKTPPAKFESVEQTQETIIKTKIRDGWIKSLHEAGYTYYEQHHAREFPKNRRFSDYIIKDEEVMKNIDKADTIAFLYKLDPRTKTGYYWIYLYSKDGGLASYADNAYVTKIKHTDFKESPEVFDKFMKNFVLAPERDEDMER